MKVAVRGVDLFFDVDGVKVSPDGPWMRNRPTVILLHGRHTRTTRALIMRKLKSVSVRATPVWKIRLG